MTYFETLTTVRTTDGHVERTQKQYDNVDGAVRSAYTRMSQFMDASVYSSVCSRVSDTLENEFKKFTWTAPVVEKTEETTEDKTSTSASTTTTEKASTT